MRSAVHPSHAHIDPGGLQGLEHFQTLFVGHQRIGVAMEQEKRGIGPIGEHVIDWAHGRNDGLRVVIARQSLRHLLPNAFRIGAGPGVEHVQQIGGAKAFHHQLHAVGWEYSSVLNRESSPVRPTSRAVLPPEEVP